MRCLYCGKQLPLLKKLTGGGEFCSETHRQKYQEEYNKLALSRLLQTQNADSDSAHRGNDLILASRQPALGGLTRPNLRALEAPKNDVGGAEAFKPEPPPVVSPAPIAGQRALPPPSDASLFPPPVNHTKPEPVSRGWEPEKVVEKPANDPALDRFREAVSLSGSHQSLAGKGGGKRDAFAFRGLDDYSERVAAPVKKVAEAAPPEPPTPEAPPVSIFKTPPVPPKPVPVLERPHLADPPEARFLLEPCRIQDPAKTEALKPFDQLPLTDGRPPEEAGIPPWDPEIYGSGGFGEGGLLPLPLETGPPGVGIGSDAESSVSKELSQEKKGILESQVKPGEFKQAPPKAPQGLDAALPVRPPAPALATLPLEWRPRTGDANPFVYSEAVRFPAPGTQPAESGLAAARAALLCLEPEAPAAEKVPATGPSESMMAIAEALAPEVEPAATPEPAAVPVPVATAVAEPVKEPLVRNEGRAPVTPSAHRDTPVRGRTDTDFPRKTVSNDTARTTPTPSMATVAAVAQPPAAKAGGTLTATRHEVFVDLSVLGIEEDEDADAESRAREGESPPGVRRERRRPKQSEVRGSLPAIPTEPARVAGPIASAQVSPGFGEIKFQSEAASVPRLHSVPMRPKIVLGPETSLGTKPPSQALVRTAPVFDWSAKRLSRAIESKTALMPAAKPNVEQPAPATPKADPVEQPREAATPKEPVAQAPVAQPKAPAREVGAQEAKAAVAKTPEMPSASAKQPNKETTAVRKPDAPSASKPLNPPSQGPSVAAAEAAVPPAARPKEEVTAKAVPAKDQAETPAKQDKGQAKEMAKAPAVKTAPADKPPAQPPAAAATTTPAPAPPPPFEAPTLALSAPQGGFWANLPVVPKLALVAVVIAAVGAGAWWQLKPAAKAAVAPMVRPVKPKTYVLGASLMGSTPGGWNPDWGGELSRKKGRTISFFRPSANHADYRVEFDGQIDSKGLGWVVRASDQKNYYSYKIEVVKQGLVALSRSAVIAGDETQRHYTPLQKPLRLGMEFRVRMDVLRDEMTVFINDELIDIWNDDRLPRGGVGLMTETGESAQVTKLQIHELTPGNAAETGGGRSK